MSPNSQRRRNVKNTRKNKDSIWTGMEQLEQRMLLSGSILVSFDPMPDVVNDRPDFSGNIADGAVGDGAAITVTVNGHQYTEASGDVSHDQDNNNWTLLGSALVAPLTEGTIHAIVRADNGADWGDATLDVTVDATAPVVTIADKVTSDSTPSMTGTIDDATAAIEVEIDGDTYTSADGDITIDAEAHTWTLLDGKVGNLADDTYEVTVTATDEAGNAGTDTAVLTVDATEPTVTVDDLLTSDNTPNITGTFDDNTATLTVTVDGVAYTGADITRNIVDGTWTLPGAKLQAALDDGTYDVEVSSTDAAGNVGTDATEDELVVDTTGPVVTITHTYTDDATPEIGGTLTDASDIDTFEVSILIPGGDPQTFDLIGGDLTNNGDGTWTLADDAIDTLDDGTYTVVAVATDELGNQTITNGLLTIDTEVPTEVTLDDVAPGNDPSPALSGTVDNPAAAIVVTVDGSDYDAVNNHDGTWTLAAGEIDDLASGSYDVTVTATNGGDDTSTTVQDALVVDVTGPVVTVDFDLVAAGQQKLTTNDTTPNITGTIDDDAATLTVTVNGHTYTNAQVTRDLANHTWTLAGTELVAPLAEGTYDIAVTATDIYGNASDDAQDDELTVDTTAPVVAVDDQTTSDRRPEVTGTLDDANVTLVVTINGKDYTSESGDVTIDEDELTWTLADDAIDAADALADNTYVVTVVATDVGGNPTTATGELIISNVAPAVTVDDLVTNDTTPVITGTVDNVNAVVRVAVDGHAYFAVVAEDGTWAATVTNALAEGDFPIDVLASNGDGETAASGDLTVDTTAPAITMDAIATPTDDNTPDITGTIDDDTAVITVTIGDNDYAAVNNGDGTWTLAGSSLPAAILDGTYDVTATAEDAAGNEDTTDVQAVEVETGAPVVTVDAISTNDTTPALTGTVDDISAAIVVTVEGVDYDAVNNGDGTWTLADNTVAALAAGAHDVTVAATDVNDNVGTGSGTVIVDLTAPTVAVNTVTTNDTTPVITGTVSEFTATVSINVNGHDYDAVVNGATGAWTATVTDALAAGTYNVTATATDLAGNSASDSTTNELVVDLTAPSVTLNDLTTTTDTTPIITGTVSDVTATVIVTVNGHDYTAAVDAGTGAWTATVTDALTAGGYNVSVIATDTAGNASVAATDTLTVDTNTAFVLGGADGYTSLTYTDADGTLVTISLQGKGGEVEITLSGVVGITTNAKTHKATVVAADVTWIDEIDVVADAKGLTFKTKGGTTAGATIGSIIGDANLRSLSGKTMSLDGGIGVDMAGLIMNLSLESIHSAVYMSGADATGKGVVISVAKDIDGGNIVLSSANIKSLTTGSLLNSAVYVGMASEPSGSMPDAADITAGFSIAKLTVKGYKGAAGDLFANSFIASDVIKNASLKNATLDNDGTAFGFTATAENNTHSKLTLKQANKSYTYTTDGNKWLTDPIDLTVTLV